MAEDERSYLPLMQSPFLTLEEHQQEVQSNGAQYRHSHQDEESGLVEKKIERADTFSRPGFRRLKQAGHRELFFDLFFVANLTVFTYEHEINDSDTLRQYIGFFCLLWFTWYQISLHDVRFSMDSAFERVCRAIQLLVMIGFAICGPKFNPGEETNDADGQTPNIDYFQALSIVLMISRLVLVVQYLQALFFARTHKKSILPLALVAATYFIAAMVYLGMFWGVQIVNAEGDNHTYYTWYGLAVLEAFVVMGISIKWRNLSYEGTHILERMSLLTLIILGEGVISVAKAVQYITYADGQFTFTGSVAGEIVCAVLILYFLYMIYFDWQDEENENGGIIRTQIWSFLHFPLHLALVLAVAGISQCITWNAAVRRTNSLFDQFNDSAIELQHALNDSSSQGFITIANDLNHTAVELISTQLARSGSFLSTSQGIGYLYQVNASVIPTIANGLEDPTSAENARWWLLGVLSNTIFKIGGFYVPETKADAEQALAYAESPLDFSAYPFTYWKNTTEENTSKSYEVFQITFTYFFISIGLTVFLLAVLAALNRGRQTKLMWGRLLATAVIGIGLSLNSLIVLTQGVASDFILSPWLLPTVCVSLFCIVVVNAIKLPGFDHKRKRRSAASSIRSSK